MEFKLFDKPDYAAGRPGDAAWYKDRAVSDHIHEPGHRERLLQAVELVIDCFDTGHANTVADWACGNGGLLSELKKFDICSWGYDMSPLAVQWAVEKNGVDASVLDVTKWDERRKAGQTTVLTEFLEHLENPHVLVENLYAMREVCDCIVASVPGFEDPRKPYEFHLWCWHAASFADMFTRIGWKVERHFFRGDCGTQFLVAGR